jgi:hypothetical protein
MIVFLHCAVRCFTPRRAAFILSQSAKLGRAMKYTTLNEMRSLRKQVGDIRAFTLLGSKN